jgi:spermidine synthase
MRQRAVEEYEATRGRWMVLEGGVFFTAAFVSAALLFMVQPIIGKILLPPLGGSPAVWNTCMVFFQLLLVLGYAASHLLATRLTLRGQVAVQLAFLAAVALLPPPPVDVGGPQPDGADHPQVWLVRTLMVTVGLPFFAVATLAPLLQAWLARGREGSRGDPYRLYAASNAGSLLGLLAYPLLVEPSLTRGQQTIAWTLGFRLLVPLVAAAAAFAISRAGRENRGTQDRGNSQFEPPTALRQRLLWGALAAVPSSLVLGVTLHLSTDVAAVPLLWVVPLGLYLTTYVIAFLPGRLVHTKWLSRIAVFTTTAVVWSMLDGTKDNLPLILALHLANFFVLTLCCHKRLADLRPGADRLTEFYLCMSLGGFVGGCVTALLAPRVFQTVAEYPLAIGLACILSSASCLSASGVRTRAWSRFWELAQPAILFIVAGPILLGVDAWVRGGGIERLAGSAVGVISPTTLHTALVVWLPVLALLAAWRWLGDTAFAAVGTSLLIATTFFGAGRSLWLERTFFGVLRVSEDRSGQWHTLMHGSTVHGVQAVHGNKRAWPTTYYHPTGPIGSIIAATHAEGRLHRMGVIGLGVGSLAAYCDDSIEADFYEIDDAVIRIAERSDLFTFLADARESRQAKIVVHHDDGRLGIERAVDGRFDLVVVDAFSSDAIPVHLLTREAVELYLRKASPMGVVAFNISNRHFDLRPVLASIVESLGVRARIFDDEQVSQAERGEGKYASLWVVVAASEEALQSIVRREPRWAVLQARVQKRFCWTDDYSSMWGILHRP